MLKEDGTILLGKAGDKEVIILPSTLNRHGLIAGASGTGKTVTLKVIAEALCDMGVPTVIADVKGDLTGMIEKGDQSAIQERLDKLNITGFETKSYPVHFFDVFGKRGHPIRAQVQEMGPQLLSKMLDLSDVQEGVLNIVFKAASDMNLDLIDLKDLQSMTTYVGQHSKDYSLKYGNVTTQSIGAIQRKLLVLEQQGADQFFGMPSLDILDWMVTDGGRGVMNMIECQELFQQPALYALFLYWMLNELYVTLPEVGDLDKPKVVFFFDEAHVLFENASKELLDKIILTIKLIRSKGAGIFFITQSPADIPDAVLAQLSTRIQHSLRAYTPAEIKAVKTAASSYRQNPAFDTAEVMTAMKTGEALVSVLDAEGEPTVVERTMILPPQSSMKAADEQAVQQAIASDRLNARYDTPVDPESAYEAMDDLAAEEEKQKAAELEAKKQAKLDEAKAKQEARDAAKKEKEKAEWGDRLARKTRNKVENEVLNYGVRSAKKFLKNLLK